MRGPRRCEARGRRSGRRPDRLGVGRRGSRPEPLPAPQRRDRHDPSERRTAGATAAAASIPPSPSRRAAPTSSPRAASRRHPSPSRFRLAPPRRRTGERSCQSGPASPGCRGNGGGATSAAWEGALRGKARPRRALPRAAAPSAPWRRGGASGRRRQRRAPRALRARKGRSEETRSKNIRRHI